jgi:hypothetical protein
MNAVEDARSALLAGTLESVHDETLEILTKASSTNSEQAKRQLSASNNGEDSAFVAPVLDPVGNVPQEVIEITTVKCKRHVLLGFTYERALGVVETPSR